MFEFIKGKTCAVEFPQTTEVEVWIFIFGWAHPFYSPHRRGGIQHDPFDWFTLHPGQICHLCLLTEQMISA